MVYKVNDMNIEVKKEQDHVHIFSFLSLLNTLLKINN